MGSGKVQHANVGPKACIEYGKPPRLGALTRCIECVRSAADGMRCSGCAA